MTGSKQLPAKIVVAFIVTLVFFLMLYWVHSGERFVFPGKTGSANMAFEKALILEIVEESLVKDEHINPDFDT